MLQLFLLDSPFALAVVTVLLIIGYGAVLKKMELPVWNCIIPCLAEWRLSTVLFQRRRSFWRPAFVTAVLACAGCYLDPLDGTAAVTARILLFLSMIVYGFLILRLYWRLSKAFGKGILFTILLVAIPPLGLCILGFGRSEYVALQFKPSPIKSPFIRWILRACLTLISIVEALALIAGVAFITVRAYPPRWLANMLLNDVLTHTADVTGTGTVVTREDSMGEAYASLASLPTSREKFFPDHSQDQSVVVLAYIVGSDLEDMAGLASANIAQMIDATKQGSGLTFVLECGGSKRWFTKGIKDESYGRYVIRDGKLAKALDLPSDTCMSTPEELGDFITWTKENYPADRYMLTMWDHGSGLGMGYGYDALNKRDARVPLLLVSEIAQALEQSGVKFDLIGFDACLMQDIEAAAAFEPYADFYLASEEVEGGYGWFYTSAFGMLAQNPGMSTEDFGREMIACYDPYNTIINSDNPDTSATLSFVDLTLAKPAYEQLNSLFDVAHDAILESSGNYASLSLAGTKSYTFENYEQVDLVDFLTKLDKLDYEDKIISTEDLTDLVNTVRACVLYRNGDSAEGVNGIALTFPVESLSSYTYDYEQFKAFSFDKQESLYNDFFSIMAAQHKKALDQAIEEGDILDVMKYFGDYTEKEWYVKGFEDYETQDVILDIPLTEVDDGYVIELPQTAWDIMADSQIIVYQKTEDGLLRYLGMDSIGALDEAGHPMVAMGDTWVHVGGQLVCYESKDARETDEGIVFAGTTRALLNGEQEVILHIEWDPVSEDQDAPVSGRIVGYDVVEEGNPLLDILTEQVFTAIGSKARQILQPGDSLEFLFDYYDEAGELVKKETYGKAVVVTSMERVDVEDAPLGECDIVFGGVLTDVYQRVMTTEKIEAHVA